MYVGYARFDLRLTDSDSLKDKRSTLRSLESLLHRTFRCAVAEVEYQDLRQRATLGVSVVDGTAFHARKVLAEIERRVESQPGIEMLRASVDVLNTESE